MLVLNGNIPRFPWEPSTTMLTYRLKAPQRLRRHTGRTPHPDRPAHNRRAPHPSSLAPASTKGALGC